MRYLLNNFICLFGKLDIIGNSKLFRIYILLEIKVLEVLKLSR